MDASIVSVSSANAEEKPIVWRSPAVLVSAAVLLSALMIRLWLMPPLYNQPEFDEPAYMIDGLLVLEGVTPGYKFAPGAATTWPGFVYGAVTSLGYLLNPTDEIARQPTLLKPLFAIDRALFDAYADYSGLRAVVMGTVLATSMFGVFMAAWLGAFRAGWPGALLCGGLMAFVPAIALLSVEARPYAAAWSFGLAAIAFAAVLTGRWRWIGAGLCFGLAVASRVELVLIAPLIAWEFWLRPEAKAPVLALVRVAGVSLLTFLVAAPWYLMHVIGNVRKMVTVPLEPGRELADELGVGLVSLLWSEGLLAVVVLLVLGLALRPGRRRLLAIAAGLIVVVILVFFGGGKLSKYNGVAWIGIIALAPFALNTLQQRLSPRRSGALAGAVALLLVLPALAQTVRKGQEFRAGWVEPKVVEWLSENVPAGALVYSYPRQIKAVPPTEDAAERSWLEVAGPDVWRTKLRDRIGQTDLVMDRLPRALSREHMYQRLGPARRAFFLASPYWSAQPRYDVRIPGYVYDPMASLEAPSEAFRQTGGVLVHYGRPIEDLGEPAAAWIAENGIGMFIYLRPEPEG